MARIYLGMPAYGRRIAPVGSSGVILLAFAVELLHVLLSASV